MTTHRQNHRPASRRALAIYRYVWPIATVALFALWGVMLSQGV